MKPDRDIPHGSTLTWGIWEAGACALFFSLPTVMHAIIWHWGGRERLQAFEWTVIALAVLAALVLSYAAGGLTQLRSFLSAGFTTSCAWTLTTALFRDDPDLASSHFLLALLLFVAQINLLPVALYTDFRTCSRHPGVLKSPTARRALIGSAAAAALMDLFPLVMLLLPQERSLFGGMLWIGTTSGICGAVSWLGLVQLRKAAADHADGKDSQ